MTNEYVQAMVDEVNDLLTGDVRYSYVGRNTESGSAILYKFGTVEGGLMVVSGSERDSYTYLRGVRDGLKTAVAEEERRPTLEESMPIGWPRPVRPGTDR